MPNRSALVGLLLVGCACNPDRPERGCIQVDGRGHYRDVADAIALAESGATLELCQVAIVESVTVDKAVTIVGLGAGESLWIPPDGEPAAVIEGGGELILEGVGLTSTTSTFVVEAGGELTLRNSLISQPGGWGIEATDAAIVLDGSVIEGAAFGAVSATGATATVDVNGSRLDGNLGWGVKGVAGATITIDDSFLLGTFVTDDTASEFDGFAVGLESGSTATITGGTADANVLGVLYGEGGSTATIDGLDASGNYFGVWGETLNLTISNSTLADSAQYDILAVAGSVVTLDNVDVTIDPGSGDNLWQDESNTLVGHYGLVMQTGKGLTIRDSEFSGHNGGALFVIGAVSEDVPVTIERTVIDDNGTQGALFQWAEVTMTDVDVTNTRDNPVCLMEDGTIVCNWAVAAFAASLDWTGGSLKNSAFMGMLVQEDSASLVDVEMADNEQASVWAEMAALRVEQSTISGSGEFGVYSYDTTLDLIDVDFIDRDWTWISEGTNGYDYGYNDRGTDLYAFLSTVNIDGTTFSNGDSGLYLSNSETTVTDSSFTNYVGAAASVTAGSFDADRLAISGNGPRAITCNANGTLSLGATTFTNTVNTTETIDIWLNDVPQTPITYQDLGPAIQVAACASDFDTVTIDGADDRAIDVTDGDVEFNGVVVRDTARLGSSSTLPAVRIRYTSRTPVVFADGLEVTGVHYGDAVTIQGRTTDTTGLVSLTDLRLGVENTGVSGVGGHGLSLLTLGCDQPACVVDVLGLVVENTGGHGLFSQGSWTRVDGIGDDVEDGAITGAGANGIQAQSWVSLGGVGTGDDLRRDGSLQVANLEIASPGVAGVRVQGSAYSLDQVVITDAGGEGVDVDPWLETGLAGPEDDVRIAPVGVIDTVAVSGAGGSGVAVVGGQHTVGGLTVTGATEYGMECATDPPSPAEDVPLFDTCAATLEGTLGALSGCDACAP